eukprot:Nk52_evm3s70 gene=Nk52_evmTU3s70
MKGLGAGEEGMDLELQRENAHGLGGVRSVNEMGHVNGEDSSNMINADGIVGASHDVADCTSVAVGMPDGGGSTGAKDGLKKKNMRKEPITVLYQNGNHDCSVPSRWIFPSKMSASLPYFNVPLTAFLVLGMEFAQQWAFVGFINMFTEYAMNMLGFSSATANSIVQAVSFWTYINSALFAVAADAWLGKFKAACIAAGFYLVGLISLTLSSSPLGYENFPKDPSGAMWGFLVSCILLGVGGAMKPIIAPLAAEQFFKPDKDDIERSFVYMFWFLNLGSVFGLLISPPLVKIGPIIEDNGTADNTGYYIPFAVNAAVFAIGAAIFVGGYNYYAHRLPHRRLVTDFFGVVKSAIKNRNMTYLEASIHQHNHSVDYTASRVPYEMNCEDTVEYNPGTVECLSSEEFAQGIKGISNAGSHKGSYKVSQVSQVPEFEYKGEQNWVFKATGYSHYTVQSVRRVFRLLPFMVFFGYYYLMYNQVSSSFIQVAEWLDKPSWVENPTLNSIDPIVICIFVPIHVCYIFPALKSMFGFKLLHVTRMLVGFGMLGVSYLMVAVLQYWVTLEGDVLDDGTFVGKGEYEGRSTSTVSVFWLALVYGLLGIGEVWCKLSFYTFLYSQAPKNMVSFVMSFFYLSNGLGSLFGVILHPLFTPSLLLYTFIGLLLFLLIVIMPLFYYVFAHYHTETEPEAPKAESDDYNVQLYDSRMSDQWDEALANTDYKAEDRVDSWKLEATLSQANRENELTEFHK